MSTKHQITRADFPLFAVLWNQLQNQSTPDIHLRMARWLERAWEKGDHHLLLMAFRSSGKSTIVGLFCAWLLYSQPELRIVVLAADQALAGKMVRNVRRIIERHPLCAHLKPRRADQWAADRFTVRRMMELRDPSMLARGIDSNLTGSRADVVICDDVEVPNTCETADKRAALREKLAEIDYVLVPGGTQLYVGTPHAFETIYADTPREETGEDRIFLDGFKRLKIPVLDEKGESAWPERFCKAALDHMKAHTGPNKFDSQMMLRPVNIAESRLEPGLLRIYDHCLDYVSELGSLYLSPPSLEGRWLGGGSEDATDLKHIDPHPNPPPGRGRGQEVPVKMVSASAWWDPAFGAAGGDGSVLAVVFADEAGNLYVHHVEYIHCAAADETDEATQQCRIVADLARRLYLPSITVETNGIGKFLPAILRNELAKAKAPARVVEVTSTRPKDLRILEAFDAVLAARRLFVHEGVKATRFVTEMREWKPGRSKSRDDGLDAVAGAISQHPVRLNRLYGSGSQSWMKGNKGQKAKTEFDV